MFIPHAHVVEQPYHLKDSLHAQQIPLIGYLLPVGDAIPPCGAGPRKSVPPSTRNLQLTAMPRVACSSLAKQPLMFPFKCLVPQGLTCTGGFTQYNLTLFCSIVYNHFSISTHIMVDLPLTDT